MKIMAPLNQNSTNAKISSRFARAEYFAIIDVESNEINIKANPFAGEQHGVGSRVINWCVQEGFDAIIADNLGPNAYAVVEANKKLKAYHSNGLTVDKIANAFKNGELKEYTEGPVNSPHSRRGGGRF